MPDSFGKPTDAEMSRYWRDENVKLRSALASVCACYVARFGGDVIGLASGVPIDRPFHIANDTLRCLHPLGI